MGTASLDPRELLEQLRADHQVLRWGPLPPQERRASVTAQEPIDPSVLDYLHHNWTLAGTDRPGSGSRGFRGKAEAIFGRLAYKVLGSYFHQEREFLSRVVQVVDDLERRCSELTVRCEQLTDDVMDRQVAEAENQAKLALWLHLDPPEFAGPQGNAPRPSSERTTDTQPTR